MACVLVILGSVCGLAFSIAAFVSGTGPLLALAIWSGSGVLALAIGVVIAMLGSPLHPGEATVDPVSA